MEPNPPLVVFNSFTSFIELTTLRISYKLVFRKEITNIEIREIDHICFYETSLGSGDFQNKLVIFLKPNSEGITERKLIRLKFKIEEILSFLSNLHRLGLKVLLFEQLLNIEETEYYRQ